MKKFGVILLCIAMLITTLSGCGSTGGKQETQNNQSADNHLTVYLWDSSLMGEFAAYVKQQCPDVEVEFISGNNNVFLYAIWKNTVSFRILLPPDGFLPRMHRSCAPICWISAVTMWSAASIPMRCNSIRKATEVFTGCRYAVFRKL